jgi:hypothetical protein
VIHGQTFLNVRHDMFRVCEFIAASSLVANFLPNVKMLNSRPKLAFLYSCFIDFVAFCAFNWRINLPSLQQKFMGFKGPHPPRS